MVYVICCLAHGTLRRQQTLRLLAYCHTYSSLPNSSRTFFVLAALCYLLLIVFVAGPELESGPEELAAADPAALCQLTPSYPCCFFLFMLARRP
jgi:hypothetical protein